VRSCRLLLLIAIVSVTAAVRFSAPVSAGDEWQPITPEELKMTSEPKAPGAPAIYLYRQVDRNDNTQATTEYNYLRIKILNEEGRKYANIEIPYVSQKVNISGIRARTIHPDGTIVPFDGKSFDKIVSNVRGKKIRVKTFSMPDVQVGSIIEYHFNYDFEDHYVYDSLWIVSADLFTKHAKFSLIPYARFPVRWMWPAGLPANTTPPAEGPDHIVRMTTQDVPGFEVEDFMPPENEVKFRVNFIYSSDLSIETNADKYWKQFGKKENGQVEGFIGKQREMQQAVSETTSPDDTPEEKLRKIYVRVQSLHNTSFEVGKTEQEQKREKSKPPSNVAELWKNGGGDGRSLTWLYLAMVRAAGFEAYPALVARRDEYFFVKERMNSHELNDNVVLVKVDGKDRYFDPGTPFTPFGLLPWSETGVVGLRLDKDGGTWIQTEVPDSNVSKIERIGSFKLAEEGSLEGKVTLKYSGLEGLYRRLEQRNQDDTARKTFLEEQLKDYVPAAIEAELTNKPDWTSSSAPLVAEFDVKIPGWVSGAGRRAILPVGVFSATEKHVFEHANRVYTVCFRFPFKTVDNVTVELPPDWKIGSLPQDQDRDAKAVEYITKAENKDGSLHLTRVLRSDLILVPQDKYPALRNFFQLVRSGDEQQVVLQQGAAAASN